MAQVVVSPDTSVVLRSRAEMAMRRLLFVPPGPPTVGEDAVHRMFSFSIVLSALRCLLSYVVFPIATPALGIATGVGPAWINDHRWRWAMTVIYAAVMVLVSTLLVGDIVHLAS